MIKFRCSACGEPMEAPDSLMGKFLECPQCEKQTRVPHPVDFECWHCNTPLEATSDMTGQVITCPECKTRNVVKYPQSKAAKNYTDELYIGTIVFLVLFPITAITFMVKFEDNHYSPLNWFYFLAGIDFICLSFVGFWLLRLTCRLDAILHELRMQNKKDDQSPSGN